MVILIEETYAKSENDGDSVESNGRSIVEKQRRAGVRGRPGEPGSLLPDRVAAGLPGLRVGRLDDRHPRVRVLTAASERVKYRLTVDVNLMAAELAVAGMDVLKRWMREGKIELVEVERPRTAGDVWSTPDPVLRAPRGRGGYHYANSRPKIVRDSGAASFRRVASVLFPLKDCDKLNMAQVNDVSHLIKHHLSRNELFVTGNRRDFLDDGRREALKSAFGVVAMTPADAVAILGRMEGWR